MSKSASSRLQMVQNVAARLLTGTKKTWAHYTCARLFSLLSFFLTVFNFHLSTFVNFSLHMLLPLWWSSQFLLSVPHSHFKAKGDQGFFSGCPLSSPLYSICFFSFCVQILFEDLLLFFVFSFFLRVLLFICPKQPNKQTLFFCK